MGFVVGTVAGALLAPRRGAKALQILGARFQQARKAADDAADAAEASIQERFQKARRD